MVFLLHGEDPFRTRLRVGELVESLVSGTSGARGDLASRPLPRLANVLGLTRLDARNDPPDAIAMAAQSQGLFAAPDEHRVVLVDHAEALHTTEFLAAFPDDAACILVSPEPIATGRGRARGRGKATSASDVMLPDAVAAVGGHIERIERLVPAAIAPWIVARARLHGVNLRPDAVEALAFALGPDTERIEK